MHKNITYASSTTCFPCVACPACPPAQGTPNKRGCINVFKTIHLAGNLKTLSCGKANSLSGCLRSGVPSSTPLCKSIPPSGYLQSGVPSSTSLCKSLQPKSVVHLTLFFGALSVYKSFARQAFLGRWARRVLLGKLARRAFFGRKANTKRPCGTK